MFIGTENWIFENTFIFSKNCVVYSTDFNRLMDELKPGINKDEKWRLFIDSSEQSQKAVLSLNRNTYALIPITYSRKLEGVYSNMKIILGKIMYR